MKPLNLIKILLCMLVCISGASEEAAPGLRSGAHIPPIAIKDQDGHMQTFNSLRGDHGLLILFNRSADWCPFCKAQLIDLEGARQKFEKQGIRVIAITYDSPEILSSFAKRKNIHFTMLSDPGSKVIDAFGIRNPEAMGYEAGVPIPNYYLINPDGTIRFRYSETGPADRITASYLFAAIYGTANLPEVATTVPAAPHLKVEVSQSDMTVAPGSRIQLLVRTELGPGEHLYAPGADQFGYRSVKVIFPPSSLYITKPVQYPQSTKLRFAALKETVPVFQKGAILAIDVTPARNSKTIRQFSNSPNLEIGARLEYQVCTNSTCYPPASLPLRWKVHVAAQDLDSVRAPDSIRWK